MPADEEDDWGEERRILSKYDDDAVIEAERRKKSRIVIGQTDGRAARESESDKRPTDSLETKKTLGSDYFTEQEVGLFKKPVLFGKKRKAPEGGDIVSELEKTAIGETLLATKRERKEATETEAKQQIEAENQRK